MQVQQRLHIKFLLSMQQVTCLFLGSIISTERNDIDYPMKTNPFFIHDKFYSLCESGSLQQHRFSYGYWHCQLICSILVLRKIPVLKQLDTLTPNYTACQPTLVGFHCELLDQITFGRFNSHGIIMKQIPQKKYIYYARVLGDLGDITIKGLDFQIPS